MNRPAYRRARRATGSRTGQAGRAGFREREWLGLLTGSSQVSIERTRVRNRTPDTSFRGRGRTARWAKALTAFGRRRRRGRCTARSDSGAAPRGHALWGHGWSAKRRMTRPDAGFGVKSVDLRGMRAPAAATAATASTGVGRRSTAVPSVRPDFGQIGAHRSGRRRPASTRIGS